MRYLILIVLFILAFTPVKSNKRFFKWSMIVYTIFLCLRCGQGLDYFSYGLLYYTQPTYQELLAGLRTYHLASLDTGYILLVGLFRFFNLSYEWFVVALAVFSTTVLYRLIIRYSKNYMLSLFVLYACYGIVVLESTYRQSIAMILLAGLAIPLLEKKSYIRAILIMVVAYFMHSTSAVFSVVTLIFYIDKGYDFIAKHWNKLMVIVIPVLVIVNLVGIKTIILALPLPWFVRAKALNYLLESGGFSPVATMYRLIMFIVILFALYACQIEPKTRRITYILASGYIFYFFVAEVSLLSRLTLYFELLEIIVIPALIYGEWRYKILTTSFRKSIVVICTIGYMGIITLLFNNDMSFVAQSNGYTTSYVPYVTIFQWDELDNYFDRETDTIYNAYALLCDIPLEIEK